ncbi:Protein NTR-2 [Aphelenchoides avenae]|nr:Protein NTR-2 [Aphelenchus avenae]
MLPQVEPIVAHTTVVMTLAIFGNLLLGLMILNRPKKKGSPKRRISRVQILLLHTCVADLLFALFSLGTEDLILITYPYFYGPDCICKLTRFLQAFPLYASPFLLVAISVDRYQAICRPLTTFGRHRYRRPHGLALVAWIAAILCSIPQIFVWHKTHPVYGQCATVYGRGSSTLKSIYVICFNSMAWLLPSVVSGYFYYKVCNAVWYSGRTLDRLPPYINSVGPVKKTSTENLSCHTQDYVNRLRTKSLGFRNQTSRFDQKRIQTVRLTLTIIVCNFILWAPFCLINILQAFAPQALSMFGL